MQTNKRKWSPALGTRKELALRCITQPISKMSLISNMTQYQFQRTDIKQEEMQQFVNTVTMMHCEAEQRKTNNSRKSLTLTK